MAIPSGDNVLIAAKVLVEVKDAMQALRLLDSAVGNSALKMANLAKNIKLDSQKSGKSIDEITNALIRMNNAAKPGQFGKLGVSDEMIRNAGLLAQGMDEVGKKTEQAARGFNLLRTIQGTLTAMFTFGAIQAISDFFIGGIKNARELEDTLFRLSNVERELSLSGIQVSVAGLRKGIQELKKELPIFSQENIASLVGKIAISTKDLRLTENQILDLARAVGILNIRSTENEDLNQTASKIITSLLTDQSKGVSNLGIQLNDTAIKLKAMEMGFIRSGDSVEELTKHEKELAKIQIIIDSANGELESLDEYLASNTARLQENKAAWEDLKTAVGQLLLPLLPGLTAFIDLLTGGITMIKLGLAEILAELGAFGALWYGIFKGEIKVNFKNIKQVLKELVEFTRTEMANAFFPEAPPNAPAAFKKWWDRIRPPKETETKITGAPGIDEEKQAENEKKAKEHGEKLAEIMQDNADKLEDIERDYQRKIEDINRDYAQKLEDIARDTAEKREDAERDYAQKVEDINRDAAEKTLEAQEDYRKKEIEREAEFQRRLRELREKFLFDLEDALRERDARQVLRLIRQYQMDKKNLEERRKLQQQEDAKALQDKLKDIEREKQLKLQAAKREYEEKLAEIRRGEQRALEEARRWKQRQMEDARIWYQRQLADQRAFLQRKLSDLAAAYARELSMAQQYQAALSGINTITPNTTTATSGQFPTYSTYGTGGIGSGLYNPYDIRSIYHQLGIPGYANGGQVIADKPTVAMFGEAGREMATFTPLNKGSSSPSLGGAGAQGGSLALRITISDGLIADIVESSLEKVAAQIEHVRRVV